MVTRKKSRWDHNTTNLLTSVNWILKVTFYYTFEETQTDVWMAESENVQLSAGRFRFVSFTANLHE